MHISILKASVSAFVAARAIAATDDIGLVQRGVESASIEAEVDEAQWAGTIAGMFSFMQMESSLRREHGQVSVAADQEPTRQCTPDEVSAMDKHLMSLGPSPSEGPMALLTTMPTDCKKVKAASFGAPKFKAFTTCLSSYFNVSVPCATCASNFLKDSTRLAGGCISQCLPLAVTCNGNDKTPSEACQGFGKKCMSCNKRHWLKYAECTSGGASDIMQKGFDAAITNLADGPTGDNEATVLAAKVLTDNADVIKRLQEA